MNFLPNPAAGIVIYMLVAGAIGFLVCLVFCKSNKDPWLETLLDHEPIDSINPWDLQRAIMAASDQALPDWPALTKGSLLYGALNMEELGETLEALAHCMGAMPNEGNPQRIRELGVVYETFKHHAFQLQKDAAIIRARISELPDFEIPLNEEQAIPLFDGVTDLVVVTTGLANSCGLPGAQGYEEVGFSNLSKRNPDTGRIDRTNDGKWIKGRKYRAPDLRRVLRGPIEE